MFSGVNWNQPACVCVCVQNNSFCQKCRRSIESHFSDSSSLVVFSIYVLSNDRRKSTCKRKCVFSGAMGKRTRYQQTEKAQLLLEVTREGIESSDNESTTKDLAPSDKSLVLPKVILFISLFSFTQSNFVYFNF